jgi:hypothetical protein
MHRLLLLLGGVLAFWVLLAVPARWLGGGDRAVVYSGTAALLCLIPAAGTLLLTERLGRGRPNQRLLMHLGSTGIRMFFVLMAGCGLFLGVPFFREQFGFLIWLAVFYLFTLALEVVLLLAGQPAEQRPSPEP